MYDDIRQKQLLKFLNEKGSSRDVSVLIVYTCLKDLVRNIESRRISGDPQGVFVFKQYADRYIKSDNGGIDVVNRCKFKKLLKNNMKYEISDKNKLYEFVDKMFEKMNITDDDDHDIKLRDEYICDYLLKTINKTKEDIFNELDNKFLKLNTALQMYIKADYV